METTNYTSIFIKEVLSLNQKEDNDKIDSILENHPFHSVHSSKATLLHYFAGYGNKEIIQFLLDRNYDINACDATNTTPLMIAVVKNNVKIVKALLTAGADIMVVNNKKENVLHMVFSEVNFHPDVGISFYHHLRKKFSSIETAQILMDAGCSLYHACFFKSASVIKYMLDNGYPVNFEIPETKQSPLHLSIIYEDTKTVKILLKYKANINALDIWGSTPLSCIYQFSPEHTRAKIKLLKILLKLEQVSLTSCNPEGVFQVGAALRSGNCKAVRLILKSNIDFSAKDLAHGQNVLHYIAANKNQGIARELEPYINKYNVNAVEKSGVSPLHVAVVHGNSEIVKFLLNQKALPNCAHHVYGYTPLYYAYSKYAPSLENQYYQSVELLLQKNADPQLIVTNKNNRQITIFDAAKRTNSVKQLRSVIAHLAVLEGIGVPITRITMDKINSQPRLKKYFIKCKNLLRKETGSITILKLLTSEEKKMARYVQNRELMLKLHRLSYKMILKCCFGYYFNTARKQIVKGFNIEDISMKWPKYCVNLLDIFLWKNIINPTLLLKRLLNF